MTVVQNRTPSLRAVPSEFERGLAEIEQALDRTRADTVDLAVKLLDAVLESLPEHHRANLALTFAIHSAEGARTQIVGSAA